MTSEQRRTPCEEKGYKVGDRFEVIDGFSGVAHLGDILTLIEDDGSTLPYFSGSSIEIFEDECTIFLHRLKKIEENVSNVLEWSEEVISPSHYNNGEVECIVAIKASMTPFEFQGYLKGNAIKYLWRMGLKGKPLVDVQKAQWYTDKLCEELQKETENVK